MPRPPRKNTEIEIDLSGPPALSFPEDAGEDEYAKKCTRPEFHPDDWPFVKYSDKFFSHLRQADLVARRKMGEIC